MQVRLALAHVMKCPTVLLDEVDAALDVRREVGVVEVDPRVDHGDLAAADDHGAAVDHAAGAVDDTTVRDRQILPVRRSRGCACNSR